MGDTLYIGTSGYSYDDWIGPFYPVGIQKNQMLEYYARFFNAVEINFTYYTEGSPAVFKKMEQQTPAGFQFIVKLNQVFTHSRQFTEKNVDVAKKNIESLCLSQKFSGFLAQFPFSFKKKKNNVLYLKKLVEKFSGFPLFLEFRHASWIDPRLLELIKKNRIHYVNVDEPALHDLMPPQNIIAGRVAYYRFHGRNKNMWWDGKNEQRYDYLYNNSELEPWLIEISKILKKGFKTFLFFNNHPQGKAVRNAFQVHDYLISQESV